MKRTISVLVENKFGVLARIAGLFSARGFNIDSLAVGETEDPAVSRMTIVVTGDDRTLEQVMKQLRRLIDTISVQDLTKGKFLGRELLLIKVNVTSKNRPRVIEVIETLEAKIAHVGTKSLTAEVVGDEDKIRTAVELLKPFGVNELVRTGRIAIAKE